MEEENDNQEKILKKRRKQSSESANSDTSPSGIFASFGTEGLLPKKKINIKIILTIVALIIIILGLILFIVLYVLKNNKDISCDIGENDKCKTCEKDDYCGSCNEGYKLINGKCFLSYSFKAVYETSFKHHRITLFNDYNKAFKIKKMIIDDKSLNEEEYSNEYLFEEAGNHTVVVLFGNWKKINSLDYLFSDIINLISISFSDDFDSSNINIMRGMFSGCRKLNSIDFNNFDTSNNTDLYRMFKDCISLTSINLEKFNTKKVTDMSSLFEGCKNLVSVNLSNFITNEVKDMNKMFYNCESLINIDISNFNTEKLEEISYMFTGVKLVEYLDLSNFNTKNVRNMEGYSLIAYL